MSEELRKALTTTTGGVANLIPEDLEPILVEYLKTLSPLNMLVSKKIAEGKTE